MKQIFIIALFSFSFLSVAQDKGMEVSFPHNIEKNVKVFIVGVSDYSKVNSLEYADTDARLIYDVFSKMRNVKKENIFYFENTDANKYNLLFKLYALIKEASPGDRLFFYFAGHGDVSTRDDNNGFLLLHNAPQEGYYSVSDAFRINDLEELSQIAIQKNIQMFIITDACRSGKLIGHETGRKKTLLALQKSWKNVFKMVSCDSEQLSFENTKWGNGHGVFTYYLSEALTGKADNNKDKKLLLGELHGFVRTEVTNATNYEQIPMVTGNERETVFKFDKQTTFNYRKKLQKPINKYYYDVPDKDSLLLSGFLADIRSANFFTDKNKTEEQDFFVSKTSYHNKLRGVAYDLLLVDTTIYVCTDKKVISSFSAKNLNQAYNLQKHKGGVLCLSTDNKEVLASGAWDNKIMLWNLNNNKFITEIQAHKDDVRSLKFNNDGSMLASGSDDKDVKIWDMSDHSMRYQCKGHNARVTSLFFMNDKILVSGSLDRQIIVWNLQAKESYSTMLSPGVILKEHNYGINTMKLSPGKSFFVSGDEGGDLIIWSTLSLKPIKRFTKILPSIRTITIDKNSRYIFVAGKSGIVKIIDVDKLAEDNTIKTSNFSIKKIALSEDNTKLVILSGANAIQSYTISIPRPDISSAWNKYRLLITKPGLIHLQERMKADLAKALMDTVQKTIEPFVTGNNILPDKAQIDFALKCVAHVQDLFDKNDEFITDKLIAAKYLLEVYSTIVTENLGKVADAINMTEKIKRLAPYAAYPENILNKLQIQINEIAKAKESSEKAISKNPEWTESYNRKGEALFEEGRYDEAIKTFNKIIEKNPESEKGYIKLALISEYVSDYTVAERNYKFAVQKAPKDAFVLNKYAGFYLNKGNLKEAGALLKTALTNNKNYSTTHANIAKLNMCDGKLKQAEKELSTGLYTNESSFDILQGYGNLSLKRGRYADAFEAFNTLVKLYPNNFKAHIAIADFYSLLFTKIQTSKELLNKAKLHYRTALSLKPYRYLPYLEMASYYRALLNLEQPGLIQPLIYEGHGFAPNPRLIVEMTKDSTEKYLRLAFNINKNAFGCYRELINYHHDIEQADSAMYYLNEFEKNFPESYKKDKALAVFYLLLGNHKMAEKILKKSIEKYPDYIKTYIELMELYASDDNTKKAEKVYDKYLNKFRNSAKYHYSMAEIKLNANIKGYDALFKQANRYDKNYQFAKNYIDNISFMTRKKEFPSKRNVQINFDRIGKIQKKYIIVQKNKKKGLFSLSGKMLIPMNYDDIALEGEYIIAKNKNHKKKYDLHGNIVKD